MNLYLKIGPWFLRGGHYEHGTSAGVFSEFYGDGGTDIKYGFRPVLVVTTP
jgi:hypothetical protein